MGWELGAAGQYDARRGRLLCQRRNGMRGRSSLVYHCYLCEGLVVFQFRKASSVEVTQKFIKAIGCLRRTPPSNLVALPTGTKMQGT